MKIKKLGHCCLFIEIENLKILTDPGAWTDYPIDLPTVDIILITHEHQDHFHVSSLVSFLKVAPSARVITNKSVGALLDKEGIHYELLSHGENKTFSGVLIEAFGEMHAEIYDTIGRVENTGYFIGEKLFYPGDAFTIPGKKVDVLALPVAGPWIKSKEAIDYAKEVKPRVVFPVHDAMLRDDRATPFYFVPTKALEGTGIEFVTLLAGEEKEF